MEVMTSTFWKPWGHRRKPAKCALALRGSRFLSILFFFFISWSSANIGAGAGPGDGWALRKVCLISGPCDSVGGQAPKSEPLYRCLSPSDGWQRLLTGGNEESKRRAPGPRFQLNAVLATSKRKKKVPNLAQEVAPEASRRCGGVPPGLVQVRKRDIPTGMFVRENY